MKRNAVLTFALTGFALAFAPAALPEGAAPQPAKPAAKGTMLKDASPADRMPKWLRIGWQVRGRFERPSGVSLANDRVDGYYLNRTRVDLTFKPAGWLQFLVQAQDSRVAGYNTAPASATYYNPMDLRQAAVAFNREGRTTVRVRAGRQELAFGSERMVAAGDWGMSRTFDSADIALAHGNAKLDLFGGSPVQVDNSRFDRHKPGERLFGAYGSLKDALPGMTVEPFVLFKRNVAIKSETGLAGEALVASPGFRVTGKAPGRVDYAAEAVLQRGSFSSDRISAFAQSYVAGWTVVNTALKPRLSAEFTHASGDAAQKDGLRATFDQFYPSAHTYNGQIDQFGWKNLKNLRAGFDCAATRKLKLRFDFNEFYLATVQDSLYGTGGSSVVLNRKATSSRIGAEVNATATYQWSKLWKFGAGYGRLWAGGYLKQSKLPYGYSYPYLMFAGTF
jgi:hypothetical protein